MKTPIVVNLFAGPGAGKSTGAAYIFSQLKMRGINCELITEYAKDLTWEGRKFALGCQEYVFGKQSYRMQRCRDQVDVVVTDSPLPLSWFYNSNPVLDESFKNVVMNVYNSYYNLNYFIERRKAYNPIGRNQTEDEAKDIDRAVLDFLPKHNIDFTKVDGGKDGYDMIVTDVMLLLKYINDKETK